MSDFIKTSDKTVYNLLYHKRVQSAKDRALEFGAICEHYIHTNTDTDYQALLSKSSSQHDKARAVQKLDAFWQHYETWAKERLAEHIANFKLEPIPWLTTH